MAKLILVSVFCICLLIQGTIATLNAGDACGSSVSDTCDTGLTCEEDVCKIKAGETCPAGSTNCIDHADCTGATGSETCTCTSGFAANSLKTKCAATAGQTCSADIPCVDTAYCESGTCKVKEGETCTAADKNCIANAECKGVTGSEICTCQENFTVNTEKTKCAGATGIGASFVLIAATYLTSHFL